MNCHRYTHPICEIVKYEIAIFNNEAFPVLDVREGASVTMITVYEEQFDWLVLGNCNLIRTANDNVDEVFEIGAGNGIREGFLWLNIDRRETWCQAWLISYFSLHF
jgi:hypothetical protein